MPISKDSFTIRVRQGIPLLFGSDKGCFYYSNPTTDSFTIPIRQGIPLLFGSDKRFCTIPLAKDSFTIALSKDSFSIRVRQGILYYSSPKGFLYYSGPTKNSFTIRVRQRIPVLFVSDKRAHPQGERELRADSSFSLARVGTTSIDRDLGSRIGRKERLEAEPLVEPQSFQDREECQNDTGPRSGLATPGQTAPHELECRAIFERSLVIWKELEIPGRLASVQVEEVPHAPAPLDSQCPSDLLAIQLHRERSVGIQLVPPAP